MAGSPIPRPLDVSLIVIAYNERDRGPSAVRAILGQDGKATFEVVFVDDGSIDGTAEAVTAAADGDKRFRLIRLPDNRGRGAARQAGVEAARGRAIGFVDADITLPPDWLRRCLEELPGNAAVGGTPVPNSDAAAVARISGAVPRERTSIMPITGSNVLFDADVFAHAGFDPGDRMGEDTRFAARLLAEGHQLRRIRGLFVRHDDGRTYLQALRWRFENGIDASSLPRELRAVRASDISWIGWLSATVLALGAGVAGSPGWLLLWPAATVTVAVIHTWTRFQTRPIGSFVVACLVDVPLVLAYLAGRTAGIPRLIRGRR